MQKNYHYYCALLLGGTFVLLGAGVVVYVAWQALGEDVVANKRQSELVKEFANTNKVPHSATSGKPRSPKNGETIGIVRIPRFGADYAKPLLQGKNAKVLARGVGHYPDTALPCAAGNFAMAGHRTSHGRPFYDIDKLKAGDKIVIETKAGTCTYRVSSHEVVDWYSRNWYESTTDARLVMTACHPKYQDRKRYIVHARLISKS